MFDFNPDIQVSFAKLSMWIFRSSKITYLSRLKFFFTTQESGLESGQDRSEIKPKSINFPSNIEKSKCCFLQA